MIFQLYLQMQNYFECSKLSSRLSAQKKFRKMQFFFTPFGGKEDVPPTFISWSLQSFSSSYSVYRIRIKLISVKWSTAAKKTV